MAQFDFDAVVVGAGAVGLACGYALSKRGLVVAVLEREAAIGQGVSSRNSEVIHGGLYYPTGSLKARLCVAGRRALYAFLEAHKVAFDRCGKLVVATSPQELPQLEAIGCGLATSSATCAWATPAPIASATASPTIFRMVSSPRPWTKLERVP